MRNHGRFPCLALLLVIVASTTQAQGQTDRRDGPAVATAVPVIRVTTENPREINIGKPATFVFSVTNEGKFPATGIVLATRVPAHAELTASDPQPMKVEEGIYKFRVGDLAPGTSRRVTLVVVPRKVDPIELDSTIIFATSTRSSVLVRRPMLKVVANIAPQVVINSQVKWSVRVTNIGDGPAADITVTPTLVEGEVSGKQLEQPVKIGSLKPGETKEVEYTIVPIKKGNVLAKFESTNPDGLEASQESTFQVLQAELAVAASGPKVQPMARESIYEIRVTNPGDAPTGWTTVTVKVPEGLDVTSSHKNAYDEKSRSLRWRITSVKPSAVVAVRFQAETIVEGDQKIDVVVEADNVASATATHTTNVISRPNPVVTVYSDQEYAAVGAPVGFKVVIVNAGSKTAEAMRVRVAIPEGLEAVESNDYEVTDGHIEFPARKLESAEKVTLAFRTVGRRVGEHRVRVLIDGIEMSSELAFEGSAFCYSDEEAPNDKRTAKKTGESSRR